MQMSRSDFYEGGSELLMTLDVMTSEKPKVWLIP